MSEFQAIKNPAEARRLLKLGNQIVDIAPKKEYGKENETVFFFKVTDKLYKDLGWKKWKEDWVNGERDNLRNL